MSAHWNHQPLNPQFRTPPHKLTTSKPLYSSMMPHQFYQPKLSTLQDKKLIKQLIKHFSNNDSQLINKSDILSRILTFNANVQDIELENATLNQQVIRFNRDLSILKGQVRSLSQTLKEKDDSMLILKGKLYQKDQSLKQLNHKLNKIIQAIQSTPNQQFSFSIEDIPKLIIQQVNESDMSLTIPDTPSDQSIKLVQLQAENRSLKDKISTMESSIGDKSKEIASNEELKRISGRLSLLIVEKGELDLKFKDCQMEMKRLREENVRQQIRLSQAIGFDQVEQLKSAIRDLEEKLYSKNKENQSLNIEVVKLKQSDKMYKDRIEEVNRVNALFNEERKKIERLVDENKYEIGKLIRENHTLRADNSRLVSDINMLKREIQQFVRNKTSNGFNTSINISSNRQEQLIKKNKRLENSLEEFKTNMEQFQHRHGNEIRTLQAKLSLYESQQK